MRGSKRSLKMAGHLSKRFGLFFLSSVCIRSSGNLKLARHLLLIVIQNKCPEALSSGCLLGAPGVSITAAVGQMSCAPAALGRGALDARIPHRAGASLQPASGNAKGPGNQIFGKLSAENAFLRWS